MKKLPRNLIALLFGIILALVIGEIFSRVAYKKLYPAKPWYERLFLEQAYGDWRNSVKLNSFGLRDRDYPVVKSANSRRVLILGDSFTYGSGTRTWYIFPELLENQLNSEFSKSGKIIEVLNGGIIGSMTNHWLDLLLKVKDSFTPDVVLIVFFLRDGSNVNSQGAFFEPIRDYVKSRNKNSWLYQHSYLVKLYRDSVDRLSLSKRYSKRINQSYFGNAKQTREWEKAKANILKIKTIAQQMNAKVGLVVFPVLVDLNQRYPFKKVCDLVMAFSKENNIPAHNLLPAFTGKYAPDLWVSDFDQHPNPIAHKIAADSILPFLKELLKK